MKTNRVKIIVLAVFVLTLGAGVVAGLLAARLPSVTAGKDVPSVDDASLAGALSLTPDQREKMRKIWEGVKDISDESLVNAEKALHERDEAIRALIPKEKAGEYNAILYKYQEASAVLKGRRTAAFDRAIKESNEILNPDQQKKYRKILEKRLGSEFAGSHDPIRGSEELLPTTQPSQK